MQTLEKIDFQKLQDEFPFVYDVIVIGGGTSGISVAVEVADKGFSVLLIEETGLLSVLEVVSEFKELGVLFKSDVFSKSRVETMLKEKNIHVKQSKVVSVYEIAERVKKVFMSDGVFLGKTVVIATGVTFTKREVPNVNLDLSIDPMMDIVYYIGKSIAVLGGNIHALRIAEYFSPLAKKVHLILESEIFEASAVMTDRLYSLANVTIYKQKFFDLIGDTCIKKIMLDNSDTITVDCVFDCSYPLANTFYISEERMYKNNYIEVNEEMESSIPGVYAIGACRLNSNSMTVSGINDAHIASKAIERYLLVY